MPSTTTALVHRDSKTPSKLETVSYGPLRADEALVAIHATGICHTDLSCMDGTIPVPLPCVFGHEGGGEVLETGASVQGITAGDKVLLSFAHCSTCPQCTSGHPAYCHEFADRNFGGLRPDGTSALAVNDDVDGDGGSTCHSSFFGQSCFMQKAVVHRSSLVKVPADTPLELFAALGCGLMTGAGCVFNTLDVPAGATLAVWGCGTVGMASIIAGKMRGAGRIVAVDLQQSRLELARELGATDVVDGAASDAVRQIRQLCPPSGVRYALDTTGVPKVIANMIDALGSRGRGATIGAPAPGVRTDVDIFAHLAHGREYIGCCEGDSVPRRNRRLTGGARLCRT
jgi:Zn-dependent alcohol dehydrogenase